ncbi:MAG TPA: VWA domain-containing protein [Chloroflexota bacterium]|nr:VWA domain-containing protein [Chloroflexota bacterium]
MIDTGFQAHRGTLLANVIDFGMKLRARGMLVTPSEAIDSLRALGHVDISDRDEFYLSLRTVMAARVEDFPIFDEVFRSFWPAIIEEQPWDEGADQMDSMPQSMSPAGEEDGEGGDERVSQEVEAAEEAGGEGEDEEEIAGYSAEQALAGKDFSMFRADELEEMIRITLRMARKMATRMSRRMQRTRRGHRIDPRRTVRNNLKYGGDVIELAHKKRKIKKTKLVLLCDVSGSMDIYSRFLLQFIYALQSNFARTESFVFSTQLSRVTEYFKDHDIYEALDVIAREVLDWSGGTRIGQSLADFNENWAASVIDTKTVVIVLSDGWDTGDADVLEHEMQELQRRAARVIWLNPLMSNPGYQPLCRGMRTALPYIEVFAPAHNLASLMELEEHLVA